VAASEFRVRETADLWRAALRRAALRRSARERATLLAQLALCALPLCRSGRSLQVMQGSAGSADKGGGAAPSARVCQVPFRNTLYTGKLTVP
jgi:hypothetical protein